MLHNVFKCLSTTTKPSKHNQEAINHFCLLAHLATLKIFFHVDMLAFFTMSASIASESEIVALG